MLISWFSHHTLLYRLPPTSIHKIGKESSQNRTCCWEHQRKYQSSAPLALCQGNPPVTDGFSSLKQKGSHTNNFVVTGCPWGNLKDCVWLHFGHRILMDSEVSVVVHSRGPHGWGHLGVMYYWLTAQAWLCRQWAHGFTSQVHWMGECIQYIPKIMHHTVQALQICYCCYHTPLPLGGT